MDSLAHYLTVIGGVFAGFVIAKVAYAVYKTTLRPGKNLKKYGAWAVVTGATDGIGKAYAKELARRGLNVLLISRTQSKLDECAKEINDKFNNIETRTLAIDFSSFNEAARGRVAAAVADLDVGVLINNVGMSYGHPAFFHELSDDDVAALIEMNVNSTTWMTRIILPHMEKRKRGAIVNIGSGAGHFPSMLLAQYSGVKGYIEMFSRTLNAEYARKGVHVQCQAPMLVVSKLSKIRSASVSIPTPEAYARVGANAIGYEAFTSPYWAHGLQIWAMSVFPSFLVNQVVGGMHLSLRAKALKKAAAAKSE